MGRKGKEVGELAQWNRRCALQVGIWSYLYELCSPGRDKNIHNKVKEEKSTVVGVDRQNLIRLSGGHGSKPERLTRLVKSLKMCRAAKIRCAFKKDSSGCSAQNRLKTGKGGRITKGGTVHGPPGMNTPLQEVKDFCSAKRSQPRHIFSGVRLSGLITEHRPKKMAGELMVQPLYIL